MNFDEFSQLNLKRCLVPQAFDHPLDEWSIAEWTNALCGESGEAANIAKKIIRLRSVVGKMNKIDDRDEDKLKEKLSQELADTILYADLCFHRIGRVTSKEIIKCFNNKSLEIGLSKEFIYEPKAQ